jgi:hypothetical protein
MMAERDGYTRTREVEASAQGLVAWCREFVGEVRDHNGVSMKGDFDQFIEELGDALKPLPTGPKPEDNYTHIYGESDADLGLVYTSCKQTVVDVHHRTGVKATYVRADADCPKCLAKSVIKLVGGINAGTVIVVDGNIDKLDM